MVQKRSSDSFSSFVSVHSKVLHYLISFVCSEQRWWSGGGACVCGVPIRMLYTTHTHTQLNISLSRGDLEHEENQHHHRQTHVFVFCPTHSIQFIFFRLTIFWPLLYPLTKLQTQKWAFVVLVSVTVFRRIWNTWLDRFSRGAILFFYKAPRRNRPVTSAVISLGSWLSWFFETRELVRFNSVCVCVSVCFSTV